MRTAICLFATLTLVGCGEVDAQLDSEDDAAAPGARTVASALTGDEAGAAQDPLPPDQIPAGVSAENVRRVTATARDEPLVADHDLGCEEAYGHPEGGISPASAPRKRAEHLRPEYAADEVAVRTDALLATAPQGPDGRPDVDDALRAELDGLWRPPSPAERTRHAARAVTGLTAAQTKAAIAQRALAEWDAANPDADPEARAAEKAGLLRASEVLP